MSASTPVSGGELIQQALEAIEEGDLERAKGYVSEDFVMEWPQYGRIYRGRESALGALRTGEAKPRMDGQPRIVGEGDLWVLMAKLRYPDGIYEYVNVLELRGGKLAHATEYWARPETLPDQAPPGQVA